MKGVVVKKENKWVVRYKHNQLQTWDNELEIYSDDQTIIDKINKEVEFKMRHIPIGRSYYHTIAIIEQ